MSFSTSVISKWSLVLTIVVASVASVNAEEARVSIWGGYIHAIAPEVRGFAIQPAALNPANQTVFDFSPEHAGFFGAAIAGRFDAGDVHMDVEAYFQAMFAFEDGGDGVAPVGGSINIPLESADVASGAPANANAWTQRDRYEFGFKFGLGDQSTHSMLPVDLYLQPFAGFGREEAQSYLLEATLYQTDSSIDWWFAGIMVGGEHAVPLNESGLDFVVHGAVGAYRYEADGDFRSTGVGVFPGNLTDSSSEFGFRGQLGTELRASISDTAQISVFGGVDYWSSTPFSQLPPYTAGGVNPSTASIGTDDVIDLQLGVKLSFLLRQ